MTGAAVPDTMRELKRRASNESLRLGQTQASAEAEADEVAEVLAAPTSHPAAAAASVPCPRPAHAPQSQVSVYLHACGRLETLAVGTPSVSEVRAAAVWAYGLPQAQDFVLSDTHGDLLETDAAVEAAITREETIYVSLNESAFHDFESQIDQLHHLQMSHLCDQFAAFRQEQLGLRAELKTMRNILEQEKTGQEIRLETTRREMDDMREFMRRQLQQGDEKLEVLDQSMREVKHALHDEARQRERLGHAQHFVLQELREAGETETKAREHATEWMRQSFEELRSGLQLEAVSRAEREQRQDNLLQEVKRSAVQSAEFSSCEVADLRKQLLDVKAAFATEQRERLTNDTDLATTLKEFKAKQQSQIHERSSETATITARCNDIETSIEAERLARQQSFVELTQQLGQIVESIQDEQTARSSEDSEMAQTLQVFRRSVDDVRRRMDDCETSVHNASHTSAKRVDDESKAREADISKLSRTLSEEVEARKDGDRQASRSLGNLKDTISAEEGKHTHEFRELSSRIENCLAGLRVEQKERVALAEELSAAVKMHQRSSEEEWKRHRADISSQTATTLDELRSVLERDLAANKKENAALPTMTLAIKELEAGRQLFVERLEDVHTKLVAERQKTDDAHNCLSDSIAAVRTLLNDHLGDGHAEASQESLRVVRNDLETVRDGLTKVAEAVQQERSSRQEGDSTLRDDCREAIQQEINARLRLDAKVREQVEQESKKRQEVVEVIHAAIDEVRQGLETHTHEMAFEDRLPEEMVKGSSAPLPFHEESTLLVAST